MNLAVFWSNVFEDLKERGVEDILYMCSDGVAGCKGLLERVSQKTQNKEMCSTFNKKYLWLMSQKRSKRNNRKF